MATSKLQKLMSQDLPSIAYQKKLACRPSSDEVLSLYKIINKEVFANVLRTPEIKIQSHCRMYWGYCMANDSVPLSDTKSNCIIKLSDKWFCKQWLIIILAHEMCHQYQWDIIGRERFRIGLPAVLNHGPSFFIHRAKLAEHGISLKKWHHKTHWFTHQNITKC